MIGVRAFYEPREEQREMGLLCELATLLDDLSLILQYEEFGNILLCKRTGGKLSDDEFDKIFNWFDERRDHVSYEIRPTTGMPEVLRNLVVGENKAGEVLLVIHPSLH